MKEFVEVLCLHICKRWQGGSRKRSKRFFVTFCYFFCRLVHWRDALRRSFCYISISECNWVQKNFVGNIFSEKQDYTNAKDYYKFFFFALSDFDRRLSSTVALICDNTSDTSADRTFAKIVVLLFLPQPPFQSRSKRYAWRIARKYWKDLVLIKEVFFFNKFNVVPLGHSTKIKTIKY